MYSDYNIKLQMWDILNKVIHTLRKAGEIIADVNYWKNKPGRD